MNINDFIVASVWILALAGSCTHLHRIQKYEMLKKDLNFVSPCWRLGYFLLPVIWVVTVAELFAKFGSKVAALAVTVFVIDVLFPDPSTATVIVTVAEPPLARLPQVQVIVPTLPTAGVLQGAPVLIAANVEFAGTGSVIVTETATFGPKFFNARV
jgi:hypothetical protein